MCRVTGRVLAGERRMFGHLGGMGHISRVIVGYVREVFGGMWEVCRMTREVWGCPVSNMKGQGVGKASSKAKKEFQDIRAK